MARKGFTLIEMSVAMVLVAATAAVVVQSLAAVRDLRRRMLERELATLAAANVMERAWAIELDELTPELAAAWTVDDTVQRHLPGAEMQVEVNAPEPGAKRIEVAISWLDKSGGRLPPVRLVAWRYARQGADR